MSQSHINPCKKRAIVIGGGAWGAAIASCLILNDNLETSILVRAQQTAEALAKGFVPRLDNAPLPHPLHASLSEDILSDADVIYLVLPASASIEALAMIAAKAPAHCPVILCAKGLIEDKDKGGLFLTDYMSQAYPERPFALLSGPSFADEILKGLPAALVAASDDSAVADNVIADFAPSHLRLYKGHDPIGVAIGGAVKNVIALAAGISSGLGLGDNAKAALITRGLSETARLIEALGGHPKTISGLAGIGDLTLSAAGPHSRNMAYGMALGQGKPVPDALSEGARSAPLLAKRAEAEGLDMPIIKAVTKALDGADLQTIISDLLARPRGEE